MSIVPNRVAARLFSVFVLFVLASRAGATTFIVPTDEAMVADAKLIVTGTVEGFYVRKTDTTIETIYQIRVERSYKGNAKASQLIDIVSPGGWSAADRRGSVVDGSAHFANGERVLLFLAPLPSGELEPFNMTLGKFRFVTADTGERLLVRDLEQVGAYDSAGLPFSEKVRLEEGFLRFISNHTGERRVRTNSAGAVEDDYLVDTASVTFAPAPLPVTGIGRIRSDIAPWSANSYTIGFLCPGAEFGCTPGVMNGLRWPGAAPNVTFVKNNATHLTGAGDNGVSAITSALAPWTNNCDGSITLSYGGEVANGLNGGDNVNTVLFNATIGGAGLAATNFGGPFFSQGGENWWTIYDSDIQIAPSINSGSPSLASIMVHEFGHAIGFRHSNGTMANPNQGSGTACNSANEECESTGTAIMFWIISGAGHGNILQPFDNHAVAAVYAGGSCAPALGAPTNLTATSDGMNPVAITWVAGSGTPTGYKVWRKAAGDPDFVVIATLGNVTTHNDAAVSSGKAYLYRVTATATGAESAPSNQDFAVAMSYTDPTITTGTTKTKAAHITDLRTCVNAMRQLSGSANDSFTAITAGVSTASAAVVTELRTKLNTARALLGASSFSFTTDDTITPGSTSIKKAHIDEMRNAVR